MPGRFLEIPVFLGDYFIMPHPVYNLKQSLQVTQQQHLDIILK